MPTLAAGHHSSRPQRRIARSQLGDGHVLHRHLNHQGYTPAAIDDIVSRGRWDDWADLRRATLDDPALLDVIERVCAPQVVDPYAQRHHFWMNHVRYRRAVS